MMQVETPKEYSSHVISGFETSTRRHVADGLKLVWGVC